MSGAFEVTPRNRIRRYVDRARYDKDTIYAILDAAWVCHVAWVQDNQPKVVPTLFARRGDTLLIHGSVGSGLLRHLGTGNEVAISVALLDGLVVTKAVAGLSVNYRSAVVFGRGRWLEGDEKIEALRYLTERLVPGHWTDTNAPTDKDLRAVAVAEVAIESASAKVRTGLPKDGETTRDLPVWAGYVPMGRVMGEPYTMNYAAGMEVPEPLRELRARWASPPLLPKE